LKNTEELLGLEKKKEDVTEKNKADKDVRKAIEEEWKE